MHRDACTLCTHAMLRAGLTWAAPETSVCASLAAKQAQFHQTLWDDLAYNASQAQVQNGTAAHAHLQVLLAEVFPPASGGYPAACQRASEFVIQQALTKRCSEQVCWTVWVAGFVNFFTRGSTSYVARTRCTCDHEVAGIMPWGWAGEGWVSG
jgi:hypothetical protein